MRCHICDKALSEAEIQVTPDNKGFEPCAICTEIAMDAAYCDGFVREEPLDDPELNTSFGNGAVEVLDADTFRSGVDQYDLGFQDPDIDAGY